MSNSLTFTPDEPLLPAAATAPADAPSEASVQRMRKTAAAVELAGDLFDQATARIHEFHRAISDKPTGAVNAVLGPVAKPVTVVHDTITDLVYGSVRLVGRSVLKVGAISLKAAAPVMRFEPAGRGFDRGLDAVASAASGLVGDKLAATRSELAPVLGFYDQGQRLQADKDELAKRFPDAQSHLVVFVHGLCCN